MRRMFDELEAEFEAGLRREAEQESLAAVRAEVGVTVLWEQLARRGGGVRRRPVPSAAAWSPAIRSSLSCGRPTAPSIRSGMGPRARSPCRPNRRRSGRRRWRPRAGTSWRSLFASLPGGASPSGWSWSTGPAAMARSNRLAATTWRCPSTTWARHGAGRRCGHGGSWGSPRSWPSLFLRGADEWVLARPVGRLLVHTLDVRVELEAVHPPDATPAELDGRELAAAHQRIDLRDPDVEDRGHVLQRVEPGLDAGCGHEVLLGAVRPQVADGLRPPVTARR